MLQRNFETYTKNKKEHIRLRENAAEWLKCVEKDLRRFRSMKSTASL